VALGIGAAQSLQQPTSYLSKIRIVSRNCFQTGLQRDPAAGKLTTVPQISWSTEEWIQRPTPSTSRSWTDL